MIDDNYKHLILVVEPNEMHRFVYTKYLRYKHFQSMILESVESARGFLKGPVGYDIAFIHETLGNESGVIFGIELKKIFPDKPIVVTSFTKLELPSEIDFLTKFSAI
ncbi:hypothetical protein HZA96_05380 [Candidatus Woesearchaeota archaeon]|nr:hypothetical protein [Candidatus Woesearchaeota archaeon]